MKQETIFFCLTNCRLTIVWMFAYCFQEIWKTVWRDGSRDVRLLSYEHPGLAFPFDSVRLVPICPVSEGGVLLPRR